MRIERTKDVAVIRKIVSGSFHEDNFPVPVQDSIYHLVDEEKRGIASFFPNGDGPHMAVLPEYRGIGTELLRRCVQWMRDNAGCNSFRVSVPIENTSMLKVLEKCGFECVGFDGGLVMEFTCPG